MKYTILVRGLLLALGPAALLALGWYYAQQLLHPIRQRPVQTPTDVGLDAERVEFPARDGVCLRGWWIQAPAARGTIILCHGYSGDCSPDLEYAPWLTQAGYNLLYFDFRAHGTSDGPFTTLGFVETRDLLGAIDFLRGRGIMRVGALGFSMGGAVAIETAPLTNAIQCVVADCTYADLRTLLIHQAPRTLVPQWLAPLGATLVVACASVQSQCNLFAHSPVSSIGGIAPRPVLLIQAGEDELVPAGQSACLFAAAREPKELWRVEGALHRAVDQLVRTEYERRITAFFDRYLAAEGSDITAERVDSPVSLELRAGLSQAAD